MTLAAKKINHRGNDEYSKGYGTSYKY